MDISVPNYNAIDDAKGTASPPTATLGLYGTDFPTSTASPSVDPQATDGYDVSQPDAHKSCVR